MVYTLWGEPDSGSFMVEAALAEAGQDVHLIDIDLTKDEQHTAQYLAINPLGKIPALRFNDGTTIVQSAAILLALSEEHPEARALLDDLALVALRARDLERAGRVLLDVAAVRVAAAPHEGAEAADSALQLLAALGAQDGGSDGDLIRFLEQADMDDAAHRTG